MYRVKNIDEIKSLVVGQPFEFGSYFNYSQDRIIVDQSILWIKVSENTAVTNYIIELTLEYSLDCALFPIALHAGLPMQNLMYPTKDALEKFSKLRINNGISEFFGTVWVNRRCLFPDVWMMNDDNKMQRVKLVRGDVFFDPRSTSPEFAGVILMLKLTE